MMTLEARFSMIFGQNSDLWRELEEKYSTLGRFYHNLKYLKRCLTVVDQLALQGSDLEKAMWFNKVSLTSDSDCQAYINDKLGKAAFSLPESLLKDLNKAVLWTGPSSLQNYINFQKEQNCGKKTDVQQLLPELEKFLHDKEVFSNEIFKNKYNKSALVSIKSVYSYLRSVAAYNPEPADTTSAAVPEKLNSLSEDLAEHIHDHWSLLRLQEGWTYGFERNESLKTHSCLVPYSLLSEEEKKYDRRTSRETLKLICMKGYQIIPPEVKDPGSLLSEEDLENHSTRELIQVQKTLKADADSLPANFLYIGRAFQQQGEKVLAYESFQQGMKKLQGEEKSRLYRDTAFEAARSLADCFAFKEAEKILNNLLRHFRDGDITGQLAKIRKNMALRLGETENLDKALEFYSLGYENALKSLELNEPGSELWLKSADEAIYNGINTATMHRLLNNTAECGEVIKKVRELCSLKPDTELTYWDSATLGEAALLDMDLDTAVEHYRQAVISAPTGDTYSMRSQAISICEYLKLDPRILDDVFFIPAALLFCGHRADLEGEYRFPESDEARVTEEISNFIGELEPGFGYCSANAGSDIIFIEQMLSYGAEVHVFLPYDEVHFLKKNSLYGERWIRRYEAVRDKVTSLTVTGSFDEGLNNANYQFNNNYLSGMAQLKSASTGCELKALTLWDGVENKRIGGIDNAVKVWRNADIPVHIIQTLGKGGVSVSKPLPFEAADVRECLCMLFADVKGYSKLAGEQLILFTKHFMGRSDEIVSRYDSVLVRRSQGDGLFLAFTSLEDAFKVSLEIRQMLIDTDWKSLGLPEELTARFALDAGPCYSFVDPISRQTDLSGAHVIRAARLEPVTPPGYIFASESFAALCSINSFEGRFEFAGQVELPKNYGEMRVYFIEQ